MFVFQRILHLGTALPRRSNIILVSNIAWKVSFSCMFLSTVEFIDKTAKRPYVILLVWLIFVWKTSLRSEDAAFERNHFPLGSLKGNQLVSWFDRMEVF